MNGNRSFSDVFEDLLRNLQEIVRSEVRLARSEIREEAGKAKVAAVLLGAGAVFGLFAGGAILVAIVSALALMMPLWAAALVVSAVLLVVAAVFVSVGIKRIQNVHAVPQRAMDHLKGDIQWVKQHAR